MANDIKVKIGGDTSDLDKKVKKTKNQFRNLAGSIASAFGAIKVLTGGIQLIKSAISTTIQFNKAMSEANTIANFTAEEFSKVKKEVLELGAEFGQTTEALTKGLYDALSAGVPKENAIEFLRVATKAAIAGVTDTAVAVDGLTTVMNAFNMTTDETAKISDNMFQIVKDGKITFPELAENISKIAPMARAAGLSFDEISAAIATAVKVEKPERAMTAIKAALVEVTKQGKNLIDTVKEFRGADLETILNAGFAKRSAQGIALLSGNFEMLEQELVNMSTAAGATDKAFSLMADTTAMKLAKFQASWDKLSISITDKFIPAINKAMDEYSAMMDAFDRRGFGGGLQEIFGLSKVSLGPTTQGDVERAEFDALIAREKKQLESETRIAAARRDSVAAHARWQDGLREERVKKELKANQKIAKERQEAEKKAARQEKTFESTLTEIRNQAQIQELINKGKEKEAQILQKIFTTQKSIGRELTDIEKMRLRSAIEETALGLQLGKEEAGITDKKDVKDPDSIVADSLKRIGGTIGAVDGTREGLTLDKKRNDLLGGLVKLMAKEDKGLGGLETLI